ncbi:MAG: hypothetical protein JAY74_25510 [Candidatus Thiodiazotropha taylori]|nr:hypothetical protein [Candidatus Thiodiazotropha taylori]
MTSEHKNDVFNNAFLAIEYRPEAKEAFNQLDDIPKEFKLHFLKLLEHNPNGNVNEYLDTVKAEYAKWEKPYANDQINLTLKEAREIGPQVEKEFRRVIDVLGDSAKPAEVLNRIKVKYSPIDPSSPDPLGALYTKHRCGSEELMGKLNIVYDTGSYIYGGKHYELFVDAALDADKEYFEYTEQESLLEVEASDNEKQSEQDIYAGKALTNRGFFSKLISGDFGLAKTYWAFYFLVGAIASILLYPLQTIELNYTSAILVFFIGIIWTTYGIVVSIGVWRASNKYEGLKLWAILAKIVIIFAWGAQITNIIFGLLHETG